MAFREHTMYSVTCDFPGCGKDAQEDGDYRAWAEQDGAVSDAECNYWIQLDGAHLCPDHWRECDQCSEYLVDNGEPCSICGAPATEPAAQDNPLVPEWTIG